MLPPIIDERDVFPFKFWYNDTIQDGMFYRNELFYRLHTVEPSQRAKLFHYACKLSQQDFVIVTATDTTCSIWVSLRSPSVTAAKIRQQPLPASLQPQSNSQPPLL